MPRIIITLLLATFAASVATAERPNIVIIMADDMGYSDIGCFGSEIRTPNIDAMAEAGVRFTRFYNTGRCCPTRASLMTGLYPHQAGIGHMVSDRKLPGYIGRLNERCVTIAEVLHSAGYATALAGKWHVTPFDYETQKASHRDSWPLQRGFDRFTGSLAGGGNYYGPKGWMVQNEFVQPGDDFYYTDVVSDAAAGFVKDTPKDIPLFMYVAYTAPHWPLHAHEDDIARYDGVYDDGWDALRKVRHARMIKTGIVDKAWPLSPRDTRVKAWSDSPNHRPWRARQMQTYAAMIDRMDQGIGRIIKSLKAAGRYDNTLIVFLSDNGGCEETPGMPGIKRFATGGQDTGRWGNRTDVEAGPAGTFQSYGIAWANASNTPFRWYKSEVHEGGIATPLVAHWPAGIDEARRGSIDRQPGHVIDLMATCVDITGAAYPKQFGDRQVQPMEGRSLRAAFDGKQLERSTPLFWEHENNRAIRDGRWKLVRLARGKWELYDIEADRTEVNDLAAEHPERVKQLTAAWYAWAKRAHVFPSPWRIK